MTKFLARITVILTILGAFPALAEQQPRIVVSATAEIEATPDLAHLTLGVTSQAEDAATALDDNNAKMTALFARLAASGVAKSDIQTSGLTLNPQFESSKFSSSGGSRISGYVVSNEVHVRLRDLSLVGKVLDAAVRDGVNEFHGLRFDLANPKPVEDEALIAATKKAAAKAALMAEAAGVTLGPVLEVSEGQTNSYGGRMMAQDVMVRSAVPVAEGSVGIGASVRMIFAVK